MLRTLPAALLLALGTAASAAAASPPTPHVLFLLIDDLGFAEVAWHRPQGYHEVQTPNMDALANQGVILEHAYAFKLCSPTRSAIQSGRSESVVAAAAPAAGVCPPAS